MLAEIPGWEILDDWHVETSQTFRQLDARRFSIILLDGSARTHWHRTTIIERILSSALKPVESGTVYLLLVYGDYAPSSKNLVETAYFGGDYSALLATIQQWPLTGGTPVRNALHEGLAASLDVLHTLRTKADASWNNHTLIIISTTLIYEEFHSPVTVNFTKRYRGFTSEEILKEAKQQRLRLISIWPSMETAKAMSSIFSRIFTSDEMRPLLFDAQTNWVGRIIIPALGGNNTNKATTTTTTTPYNNSNGPSESGLSEAHMNLEVDSPSLSPSSALEVAVRQFLTAVLKLPQAQRADAIKRHLESPAYSSEYKQCVIAMVRQIQNVAGNAKTNSNSAPNPATTTTASTSTVPNHNRPPTSSVIPSSQPKTINSLPVRSPLLTPRPLPSRNPIWRGRIAFRINSESYFDVAAFPIPNPKSSTPHSTPPSAEYNVESWPLMLGVASFVSVQSPAVAKSVPISRLVEIVAMTSDGSKHEDVALAFRNLLVSRQLVGLVRLGASHAMLIAARPHQLVGMVLSRQAASAVSNDPPLGEIPRAAPSFNSSRPTPVVPTTLPQPTLVRPAPTPVLTPEAILRQLRPGFVSTTNYNMAQNSSNPHHYTFTPMTGGGSSSSNLDVFNALLGSHMMEFDSETNHQHHDPSTAPMDLDFSYPPPTDKPGSFFDNDH